MCCDDEVAHVAGEVSAVKDSTDTKDTPSDKEPPSAGQVVLIRSKHRIMLLLLFMKLGVPEIRDP